MRRRLECVGSGSLDLFTAEALERIAVYSRGIPRLVNVLCDAALLTGFVSGTRTLTPTMVEEAWADYASDVPPVPSEPVSTPAATAAPNRRFPEPAPAPPRPAEATPAPPPPAAAAPPPVVTRPQPTPPPPPPPPPVAALRTVAADGAPRLTISVPTTVALLVAVAAAVYSLSLERMRVERGALPPAAPPAAPVAPAPAPALPVAAAPPVAPGPRAPAPETISTMEAATLIDDFRAAYEARDVDKLVSLFAPDAAENGRRGLDVIATAYRSTLGGLADIRYTLKSLAVDARGQHTDVRAPFVISYRQPGGERSEIRGTAEWKLERRDGRPRIVELNYRLEPEAE